MKRKSIPIRFKAFRTRLGYKIVQFFPLKLSIIFVIFLSNPFILLKLFIKMHY